MSTWSRLAVAAGFVLLAGFLLTAIEPESPGQSPPAPAAISSPDISLMSLTAAYRQGGEEALNRQLDTALEALGPRPDVSLLSDLLGDLEG